jgi:Predicted transcriptional regulator
MYKSEVFTEEVLPAIRQLLATSLKKDYGLTQQEIASTLGVSQAMVSKYVNTRAMLAEELIEDPQIDLLIEEAVSKAAQQEKYSSEISEIIEVIQSKRIVKELSDADQVI